MFTIKIALKILVLVLSTAILCVKFEHDASACYVIALVFWLTMTQTVNDTAENAVNHEASPKDAGNCIWK